MVFNKIFIKKINNNLIKKTEDTINIEVGGTKFNYALLSDEFKVLEQAYSVYYEFSKANFEFENFDHNKIIKIIVNIIYYLLIPKNDDKEIAFKLYEILYIMNIFNSDIKKNKEKNNKMKEEIQK